MEAAIRKRGPDSGVGTLRWRGQQPGHARALQLSAAEKTVVSAPGAISISSFQLQLKEFTLMAARRPALYARGFNCLLPVSTPALAWRASWCLGGDFQAVQRAASVPLSAAGGSQ